MSAAYGVRSAHGSLRRVLVHRPGVELDMVTPATLREFHFDCPVDRPRFQDEYDRMLACIQRDGAEALQLRDVLAGDADALGYIDRRPNMTYTRDLAVVFGSGAVLMSPHLKGRWGDQRMLARAFRRLGVPIVGSIDPPGFLEGGGVTIIGGDTVVASICDRANEEGTSALRRLVLGRDAKYFLEVPLPFGHIHIDGIFMVVGPRLCLIHEPPFQVFPCRLYEKGRAEPRHVMFGEYLDERGIRPLPITLDERRGGHLNVVVTAQQCRVAGFAQATRVASALSAEGIEWIGFPSDELFKGNGGAHCMTCPVLVD